MPLNRGFDYRELVGPDAENEPLVDYLARRHAHTTREEWIARIESGRVWVDGRPAGAGATIRKGQTLVWRRPPWNEPDAPRSFAVIYRDDDLLAVAKPPGLPTLPGGGFLESTLLRLVRGLDPAASPLHRLGRWTSGLVLFARTPAARAGLTRQWTDGSVGKRYRALASGKPGGDEFRVDVPIGTVSHALLGTIHAAADDGKSSSSRIRVLERRAGTFLCDVWIATGRPHQIRIHLAAAGHPLVGDPLYPEGGVPRAGCRALPGDPGYLLHAAELRFTHPRTGSPVAIECAPPPRLRRRA
jgi:23S rRNA pseudouridine1911/1915/1917 synthase